MTARQKWSRVLVVVGLAAMLLGAVDPLEGAFVILPAAALVAAGAFLTGSRYRIPLYWSVLQIAVGVAALIALSVMGGIGGTTGRSMWWALLLIPYPVGWLMGLIFGVRQARERFA